jgi:hypothetical protein
VRTRTLREQLGARLVAGASIDFSSPLVPRPPVAKREAPQQKFQPKATGHKSPSHSWRAPEAESPGKKFQRKFHGSRRDDAARPQPAAAEVRADMLTDRKGRRVAVERHGEPPPREPPPKPAEKRGRHGRRHSSDRASGPRPRHPRGRR